MSGVVPLRRPAAVALPVALLIISGCVPLERRRTDADGLPGVTPTSPVALSVLPGTGDVRHLWNGRVFAQDVIWTHQDSQYAVWVNASGKPIVGQRRLPGGPWSTFDLSKVPGNPLGSPTNRDEHNFYVIAADRDGYLHVAGNMHNQPLRYVRSQQPGDITRWEKGRMIGTEESSVTYPSFVRRRDGVLLFFYRDGVSGHGDLLLNAFESGRWTRIGKVIDGRVSGESPYLFHVAVDGRGEIHIAFVWRSTSNARSNNDLSYARSPDGGRSWERSDGSSLHHPITHKGAEIVVNTPDEGSGLSNAGGLETDADGHPHTAILLRGGRGSVVWHVWYDGAWKKRPVKLEGARAARSPVVVSPRGRVYLLLSSPSVAFLADVSGGGVRGRPLVLAHGALGRWEFPIDTQGLYRDGDLNVMLPIRQRDGVRKLGVASVDLADAA